MSHENLLAALKMLHAELAGAQEIDEATQAQLQEVTSDIQHILQQRRATQENTLPEAAFPFSSRLRETLIELEARHPHVGGLLERITDGLAAMGI